MTARPALALGAALGALSLYACTLDFDQYRGEGTGGATAGPTTGPGGSGGEITTGGSGGTPSTGGGGSGGDASGGGGAAPGCPTDQPADPSPCSDPALVCTYDGGTEHCECREGEWDCDTCPAEAPTDGSNCAQEFTRCYYPPTQCYCRFGDWNCGECPATEPANNADCNGLRGLRCVYGMTVCDCGGGGENWDCNG